MISDLSPRDGWLIPQQTPPWLVWGFGTRHSVLRDEPAQVKQVHGDRVVSVSEPGPAGEGDALTTHTPGLLLGIKTADCLPILMADLRLGAVAAVHAGWRGVAQGIAQAAILKMQKEYRTKPNDLLVAMGPAIGPCCFEVGAEVAREFSWFDSTFTEVRKRHLDLQAMSVSQLVALGIPSDRIQTSEACTKCEREQFWSFRREGEKAGRMWSVIGIRDQVPGSPGT